LNPNYPKSDFDILNLGLLGLQLVLYLLFSRRTAQLFFLFYFAFWRTAYDAGLGWVLTKQSKKKWIVKEVRRLGWLDEKRRPTVRSWIRKQLVGKMGNDYSFDVGLDFSSISLDISRHSMNFRWSIIPGSYSVKLLM
jgi:phosphatidylethanolamine N-methyltransferase